MCILFPLIAVWGGSVVQSLVLVKPFNFLSELLPRIGQTFLAALPFLFLFLFVRRQMKSSNNAAIKGARWAGVSVLIFSTFLWGCYYYDAIFRVGGGPNIGLGILLLFSPICSVGVMLISFHLVKIAVARRPHVSIFDK